MTSPELRALLDYYVRERRDLPWRQTKDPYNILLSEVMLQQTQVTTVISYYHRFLARFPEIEALAEAPEEEVLALWSGLGYYSRARRLQETARAIAARGSFPDTEEELKELPGVGPYTAAAVASIAFGKPALALDTNALRVLYRLYGIVESLQSRKTHKELRARLLPIIPVERASDFTQALMELGALLCTPKTPKCASCPWIKTCRAKLEGTYPQIPIKPPRRKKSKELWAAALVVENGRFFLEKRESPPLKGLWTPPLVQVASGDGTSELRALRGLVCDELLGETKHGITFREIRTLVYRSQLEVACDNPLGRWFSWAELPSIGLSSYTDKILELIRPKIQG